MNLRCFELHRYHHLGQFRELWHMAYGICYNLFVLCSNSLLRSRCAEPPQVTEASKASHASKASQTSKAPQGPQSPQVGKV